MKLGTSQLGQVGFDLLLGSIYSDFDLFWFRSAQDTNFKLPIIRSTRILICTVFDLHCFRSAIFGSAKISLCSVFDLHRFRSARISIYMYFDMQINFRSMDFSICKSNFDLQIFRSANQISIYRFFDLQIKFRSTDCLICKSYFDLQIFRSANQVSIYRFFDLQIKFRSKDFSICTMYYDKIFAIFPKMNLKFTIP